MSKHVRNLILVSALVYIAAYIGRLSYTASLVGILEVTGVSKSAAGLVSTYFYMTYGCGQLLNAFLCKYYKPRPVIAGVLAVSLAANVLAALCRDVHIIKYIWLINGAAQSMLWCTLIELISRKVPTEHRKKAIFAMSITVAVGTASIYGIAALCMALDRVFLTFWLAAAILLLAMIAWLAVTRILPQIPDEKADTAPTASTEAPGPRRRISLAGVSALAVCGLFAIGNGFMKDTMTTWVPSLLYEEFFLPTSYSVLITLILPLLSFFGATVALTMHKKIPDYNIMQSILFFAAAGMFGGVYLSYRGHILPGVIVFAGLNATLMSAVNNIITSMIPLERSKGAGMFAGMMDAFCYVGSTLSGVVPGVILEEGGFPALLLLLPLCALCLAAFSLSVTLLERRRTLPSP